MEYGVLFAAVPEDVGMLGARRTTERKERQS
jgi:hypothetical protein